MQLDFSRRGTRVLVEQISTPSLGDHSYLIVVDDSAAVIDPQIDIDRFRRAIERAGAKLRLVLETHVHNDYVSGGPGLAEAQGAEYILPADTGATVQHAPLADGEARPLGPWAIRAIHTPGHTPHHMSYALESPDGPVAVFTGGSMLVAAAGRTDLIGPDWTERPDASPVSINPPSGRHAAGPNFGGPDPRGRIVLRGWHGDGDGLHDRAGERPESGSPDVG